jgi:hypothetical protein
MNSNFRTFITVEYSGDLILPLVVNDLSEFKYQSRQISWYRDLKARITLTSIGCNRRGIFPN